MARGADVDRDFIAGDDVGGVPNRVPVLEFEGEVVELARLRMLHEGDVVRLHPAGEPDREQTVGHVDALGATEVERLLEEVEGLLDVGPVEQRMVEATCGHAVRFVLPDVRVVDARLRVGLIGVSVELDAMAGGNREADAPSDPRLLTRFHMIDGDPVFLHPLLVVIEIGILETLEGGNVDARRVGTAQHDRVVVEFVGRLQIDAAVRAFGDLMQANALGVELDRSRHVENADLDKARPHDARNRHGVTSLDGLQGPFAPGFDYDRGLQPQRKIGKRIDAAGEHDARRFVFRRNTGPAHRARIV